MPLYQYVCRCCRRHFSEVLTVEEHETKQISCPKCRSAEVHQLLEPTFPGRAQSTPVLVAGKPRRLCTRSAPT